MVATASLFTLLASLAALSSAAAIEKRQAGSAYNCGCSSRKTELEALGANVQDIAITMLETGSALSGTAYQKGDGKTGDSANWGLFKNNWYMIRTACSQFAGQTADEWQNGEVLNTDDAAAIQCQHEQMSKYGSSWFGGQRDGSTGLANPGLETVTDYETGVQYIENYLNQGHLTDNMATSYNVPAI